MTPDGWLEFFLSVALRSVLLAGAGVVFYLALRRGSNRVRLVSAMAAIGSLALLPLFLGFVPRFEWAVWPHHPAGTGMASTHDLRWAFLVFWLAGSAWFLFRLFRSSLAARRLREKSIEFSADPVRRTLERLQSRLGLRNSVRLAVSPAISRPIVCGLIRPAILLPPQAVDWSTARLECVLAHELAHLSRRDLWSLWVCQIVTAFYWFNPLVWRLSDWQVRAREIAADELALSVTGNNRAGYARELLAIATEPSPAIPVAFPSAPAVPAAAMLGATSRLEDRITCLFGAGSTHARIHRLPLAIACLLALTIFAACTAFDPIASGPGSSLWSDDEVRLRLTADPFPGS